MSNKQQSHLPQSRVDLFHLHMLLTHQIRMELMGLQLVITDLVHLRLYFAHLRVLLPYYFLTLHHLGKLEGGVIHID